MKPLSTSRFIFFAGLAVLAALFAVFSGHHDALPVLLAGLPVLGKLTDPADLEDIPYSELSDRLCRIRDLANKIQADADAEDRDMNARETERISALFAEFEMVEAAMKERPEGNETQAKAATKHSTRGHKTNPDPGISADAAPGQTQWRDAAGNAVRVLAPTDRLAATVRASVGNSGQSAPAMRVGDVLASMVDGNWERRGLNPRAAMQEGTGADGGFLVASTLSSQIIDLARSASVVIAAGAMTVPMPSNELSLVRVASDPSVDLVPENNEIPQTKATFATMTLRAAKFAAIVPISRELVEDAPNAAAEIERLLGIAMANSIDNRALFGGGAGIGPGIFNAQGVQQLAVTGGAPNFDYDDLLDAIALIEGVNGSPTAAVYNAALKRRLATLKTTTGEYLQAPADVVALKRLVSNKLANSQAIVGDFRQMILGVRVGVQIESTTQGAGAFEHDQVYLKIRWRGDFAFAHPEHFVALTGIV